MALILIAVTNLLAMPFVVISVALTGSLISAARERHVTDLYSLQAALSARDELSISLVRMNIYLFRFIQIVSRDQRQELAVHCGPFFPLTYHVTWTLFAELAMLYLLFSRALNKLSYNVYTD